MSFSAYGPFIGDVEFELLHFRPWIKWISVHNELNEEYIYTYSNRSFFYNWLNENNIFFIKDSLARDESHQIRFIHSKISHQEYQELIKYFRNKISDIHNCKYKEIDHFNLSYSKTRFQVPIHNKIFEAIKFDFDIHEELKNRIVFIPQMPIQRTLSQHIYNFLNKISTPIIVGDFKCRMQNENILNKYIDYFINVYKYILKIIENAKAVITTANHWAVQANLYNVPVFTWSKTPAQFKKDGIYYFNNKNSMSVPYDRTTPYEGLLKTMEYFLKRKGVI